MANHPNAHQAAINFLEEGRLAAPFNLEAANLEVRLTNAARRLHARRVPVVTINININAEPATPPAAPRPAQPPMLQRPAYNRQNAINLHNTGALRNAFNYLQLLLDTEPSDSEEEEEEEEEVLYDFVLVKGEAEEGWECAICLKKKQRDLVWHPANCHTFHRLCLEQWLQRKATCPMCRRSAGPLQMAKLVAVEGPMEGEMNQVE